MTAPAPVFAGYVPSYSVREPYITAEEYLAAPVGTDVTQLIPGGNPAQNRDALSNVIVRASSAADTFCNQVLAATVEVQVAPPNGWRAIRDRSGRTVVQVPVDCTPLVAVNGVSLGTDPGTVTPLTDLTGLWLARKVVTIPVSGLTSVPAGAVPGSGVSWPSTSGDIYWGTVTYVCGWANTTLASTSNNGGTALNVSDCVGFYPGLQVTVYDTLFARTEVVTVADAYVPGSLTVPLSAPLTHPHGMGTQVSALPPAIRQAVISLTSAYIKKRGGESLVLESVQSEPGRGVLGEDGMSEDEAQAYALLAPFRRVR